MGMEGLLNIHIIFEELNVKKTSMFFFLIKLEQSFTQYTDVDLFYTNLSTD